MKDERIQRESTHLQIPDPLFHQAQEPRDVELSMRRGILREIGASQLEERGGGAQPRPLLRVLLKMHKRPRQLDQPGEPEALLTGQPRL